MSMTWLIDFAGWSPAQAVQWRNMTDQELIHIVDTMRANELEKELARRLAERPTKEQYNNLYHNIIEEPCERCGMLEVDLDAARDEAENLLEEKNRLRRRLDDIKELAND